MPGIKRFHGRNGDIIELRFESALSPTAQDQRLILYRDRLAAPG